MPLKTTSNIFNIAPAPIRIKGRGTALNLEGRFENWTREAFDEGRPDEEHCDDDRAAPKTIVTEEIAKSVITRNDSPDIPFRYSLNPYRGCEHGCVYCFARPSHAYLGLSPGLDFETRLFVKVNAPDRLKHELSRPTYECDVISLGVNTDAYQPCERKYEVTRQCLQIMEAFNQPVALITKSSLIERDIDVLSAMAKRNLVHVAISITTQDHQLSRYLEPRATASARRFETIRRLSAAGIPVSLNIAPVIPFLTDHELEQLIARGHASGISTAGYALLRLPWELKTLFRDWLEQHVPLKASHVMSRIQAMRSGRDNDPDFGSRMVGEGLLADLLERRFRLACRRHGLNDRGRQALRRLDKSAFRVPRGTTQGELF